MANGIPEGAEGAEVTDDLNELLQEFGVVYVLLRYALGHIAQIKGRCWLGEGEKVGEVQVQHPGERDFDSGFGGRIIMDDRTEGLELCFRWSGHDRFA